MNHSETAQRIITGTCAGILFWSTYLFLPALAFSVLLSLILIYILSTEWARLCKKNKIFWFLTPVYPCVPLILLIYLHQHPVYHWLAGLTFILAFANDTGAYFTGKFWYVWRRHSLCPDISPHKSWEGFAGGLVLTFLTLAILINLFEVNINLLTIGLYAVGASCIATLGDLFESWLKRKSQIKDTGTLLPGHGGLLDRFDSSLFLAYALFLLRNYIP